MGRRNDHNREEIKQMIVLSGQDFIRKFGFSNFSTRKIAKDIRYTVGTLYNVFESYDNIILNINAKTLDDMRKFIEEGLDPKLKNAKAIKQLANLYIEFAHNNRNIWSTLFEYNTPVDLKLPKWYNKKIEKLFSILERQLSELINKKSTSKHAKVIWAGIHGICILSLTQKLNVSGTSSALILGKSLINNYLRGIAK